MNIKEEFDVWFEETFGEFASDAERSFCYVGYKHAIRLKQAEINKKDAELAALRGFANKAILYSYNVRSETETKIILDAEKFGLIDEVTGNPTTLIKGE